MFLVLGFIEWLQHPGFGIADLGLLFVREMGLGAVAGLAVGALAVAAFRRLRPGNPGLWPVASLATLMLAYGAAATAHGSGFLAAYVAGLALGSADIPRRAHRDDVPPGPRVARAALDVRDPRAARVPEPTRRRWRSRGRCSRSS